MLAEIKSRMLLPRADAENEEEDDPRADLIRRLQEYERFKQAAEDMDELPRLDRDLFISRISRFCRRIRYSSKSSGPSNASRNISRASGGI